MNLFNDTDVKRSVVLKKNETNYLRQYNPTQISNDLAYIFQALNYDVFLLFEKNSDWANAYHRLISYIPHPYSESLKKEYNKFQSANKKNYYKQLFVRNVKNILRTYVVCLKHNVLHTDKDIAEKWISNLDNSTVSSDCSFIKPQAVYYRPLPLKRQTIYQNDDNNHDRDSDSDDDDFEGDLLCVNQLNYTLDGAICSYLHYARDFVNPQNYVNDIVS